MLGGRRATAPAPPLLLPAGFYKLRGKPGCGKCATGCLECASPDKCSKCSRDHVAHPTTKECLPCGTACDRCTYRADTKAVFCQECGSLSLVRGRCQRCDDPRCSDCSGDGACKACRDPSHSINPKTGHCEGKGWAALKAAAPGGRQAAPANATTPSNAR